MQALIATDRVDNKAFTARVKSAATTNITVVKAAPGNVYGWAIGNSATTPRFVKVYDKATAPVPASDAALIRFTLIVPGGTTGGSISETFPTGISFLNGIAYTITNLITDTDATALGAADEVHGLIAFK